MADYRIVRLLAKQEIPLLLAVPAVMARGNRASHTWM